MAARPTRQVGTVTVAVAVTVTGTVTDLFVELARQRQGRQRVAPGLRLEEAADVAVAVLALPRGGAEARAGEGQEEGGKER